jgi:alpha-1,3-mannosyltransferase
MERGTNIISETLTRGNHSFSLHGIGTPARMHREPMRITHVTRQFTPAVGGLENVVHNLAKAQIEAGQRVKVITLNRDFAKPNVVLPGHEDVDGIEVVRVPYRGSHRYPIAPTVLRHIKGADVVHVHAIDFFFDFLALTAPWHRQPLVVTPHGAFFHTRFAARLKVIYFHTVTRALLRAYRAVINVSRHDHELFQRVRSRGTVWWNNGVNVEKFRAAGAQLPRKRIIAVSRFASNKRLDRLVAFVAALRQRDPAWELVIAGSEAELSGAELHKLAQQAGVGHAVELIVRPNDDQIREAMARCSVFASASEYEAFGIAAIEGLSAGLLPLLSDIGSFSEIVERTKVGVIANFDHPEKAAEAFLAAWTAWNRDYQKSFQGAVDAARPFDWKFAVDRFDAVYERAAGHSIQRILGIDIRVMRRAEAVATLDRLYDGAEAIGVGFANAHTINTASCNDIARAEFRKLLVLNDGVGVALASRMLYRRHFPDNLNGTDFVPGYLAATRRAFKIYMLGAKPGVAERAARALVPPGSRHRVVGVHHGYFPDTMDAIIATRIKQSGADLLLVAFGNPTQEIWISRNLPATGCRLAFAVGALFDFAAEDFNRAPAWMQARGLEWLFRLAQEPGRLWRRYLVGNWIFLGRVARQWWEGYRI